MHTLQIVLELFSNSGLPRPRVEIRLVTQVRQAAMSCLLPLQENPPTSLSVQKWAAVLSSEKAFNQ